MLVSLMRSIASHWNAFEPREVFLTLPPLLLVAL